jgi:hypothetical protein
MPLRITKATDPIEVKTITACIYAGPGRGKSTLGFTAAKPLLLDFDHGAYRAGKRGDSVQIESWADVSTMTADDLKPFSTLVVDTAGRALDALSATIITENPKMGRGGSLTLQGFGELKSRFTGWLKFVRQLGLDVVLISHSDEKQNGDEMIERLDIQGGSKNEIYKVSDLMGRLKIEGGKRTLNFSPTDTAFGKNPASFPKIPVPDFSTEPRFLANIISQTKTALNRQTEEQKAAAKEMADWQTAFDGLTTVDDMNGMIPKVDKASEAVRDNVKRLLVKAGKARGFEFDKKAKAFTQQVAA